MHKKFFFYLNFMFLQITVKLFPNIRLKEKYFDEFYNFIAINSFTLIYHNGTSYVTIISFFQ